MADEKQAAPAKPDFHLVVVHPFGDYERGDKITDAEAIAAVMAGESHRSVTRVIPQSSSFPAFERPPSGGFLLFWSTRCRSIRTAN
jgi:hypothetical protein